LKEPRNSSKRTAESKIPHNKLFPSASTSLIIAPATVMPQVRPSISMQLIISAFREKTRICIVIKNELKFTLFWLRQLGRAE
jgi:hypothetical protein